jgi:hypothetical protein
VALTYPAARHWVPCRRPCRPLLQYEDTEYDRFFSLPDPPIELPPAGKGLDRVGLERALTPLEGRQGLVAGTVVVERRIRFADHAEPQDGLLKKFRPGVFVGQRTTDLPLAGKTLILYRWLASKGIKSQRGAALLFFGLSALSAHLKISPFGFLLLCLPGRGSFRSRIRRAISLRQKSIVPVLAYVFVHWVRASSKQRQRPS